MHRQTVTRPAPPDGHASMEPDGRPSRPFLMRVLSTTLRGSIGLAACATVLTACGTAATPEAESATEPVASQPESPPPLACERRYYVFLDHFGLGKGEDSPEDAAAPYQAPGTTVVVDAGGDPPTTVYVVSADGDKTLAIIDTSSYGHGWLADSLESCANYEFNSEKRRPVRPGG